MDPSARPLKSQRILCVNCNICVNTCNTVRRHLVLQLDPRVISLISNSISPVIVTEEDYICDACFNAVMQIVNAQLHGDEACDVPAGPSLQGHTQVCLICGRSVVNRQRHLILRQNPSDLTPRVIQIIGNRIAPRQIAPYDLTCHACWMRATRDAKRNEEVDERRHVEIDAISRNPNEVPDIPEQQLQDQESFDEPSGNPVRPRSPELEHQLQNQESSDELSDNPENVKDDADNLRCLPRSPELNAQQLDAGLLNKIVLQNYRRGPNTASHCIFYGCDRLTNLHSIPDPLRITVLQTYKYYIPRLAKVCSEHLLQNNWDTLYDAENSINTFTSEQVEHVFSFTNPLKQFLDFTCLESIQQMDDHLLKHWIGMTKDNFIGFLEDLPRILKTHRGILGISAMMIKMRTGESDDRLSTLLDVPRSTLKRLMAKVRDILLQHYVPRNLGL